MPVLYFKDPVTGDPIPISVLSVNGGTTDHGQLSGLADDDHTQYLNNARGDARYAGVGHNHNTAYDPIGAADAVIAAHLAASNPHAQYLSVADLIAGSNMTLTDNGDGTVTFASSGGGGSTNVGITGFVSCSTSSFSVDPSGTTDSRAGLIAFFDAIPAGGTGYIPPGTYKVSAKITRTGKSMHIIARNVTFIADNVNGCFDFQGVLGTTYNVTTVNQRTSTSGEFGNTTEVMKVTDLTCSATPSGIALRDWIKIGADDLSPDANVRSGQTGQVVKINGNILTIAGWLRESFTTNVRLAKCDKTRITWEGGHFRHGTSVLAGSTMAIAPLNLGNMLFPVVRDVTMEITAGPSFSTYHTFCAKILDCKVWAALDHHDTLNSIFFGYGVNDAGEFTTVRGLEAFRVRHAYTSGSGAPTAGSSLKDFGRTYGAWVNGRCYGSTQTAWDNHGDADNATFYHCESYYCYIGFNLRGTNHTIFGGKIFGPHTAGGVTVNNAGSGSTYSYGSVITGGLIFDGIDGDAFAITGNSNGKYTTIDGVIIKSRNTTKKIIYAADTQRVYYGRIAVAAGGTRITTADTAVVEVLPELQVYVPPAPTTPVPLTNNADAGTDTTVVTAGNSGGANGTAFNVLSGTTTFSAIQKYSGGLSYKCGGAAGVDSIIGYNFTAQDSVTLSAKVYLSGAPTGAECRIIQIRSTAGTSQATFVYETTGKIAITSNGSTKLATSAAALSAGWYRLEMTVTKGATTTSGRLTAALYPANSIIPTLEITVSNANVGVDQFNEVRFGKLTSATAVLGDTFFDDIRVEPSRSTLIGA